MKEDGFPPPEREVDAIEILEERFPESEYVSEITHPETGESFRVFDLQTMKDFVGKRLEVSLQNKKHRVNKFKVLNALFERHQGEICLTSEQVSQGNFDAKPLFYSPVSAESAGDSLEIADAEFQIPLWELRPTELSDRDREYPTEGEDSLTNLEAYAGITLFHPDYGDARRNPRDGKLYVKNPDYDSQDPESPKRIELNDTALRLYNLASALRTRKTADGLENRTAREGLLEDLPNLLASGALKLEDLPEVTLSKDGGYHEDFIDKQVAKNGFVNLAGVRQYSGKQYAGMEVRSLGKENAIVFDSEGNLVSSFTVVPKGLAITDEVESTGKIIPRTNAKLTKPIHVNYKKLVPDVDEGFRSETVIHKREAIAAQVTQAVRQILELANNAEALLKSEYNEDIVDANMVTAVRNDLLDQAKRVIVLASTSPDAEILEQQLEIFEADTRAFVALSKNTGLEQLLERPLEKVPASELSEDDKTTMRDLLEANYLAEYPGEENESFRDGVAASFEDALQLPDTEFFILRDQDRIVSFNRFDHMEDKQGQLQYFGSFNASPLYKGIGGNLLEETIAVRLQETERIFAHCDPNSVISQKYIESGFSATQLGEAWGKPSFEIWRSRKSNDDLKTKVMSIEDLKDLASVSVSPDDDYFVREVEEKDSFEELDDGLSYLLTRYFTHEGKTYAAFELNTELSKSFVHVEPEEEGLVA